MLMLLSVHVVRFNNFALTMGFIGVTHTYSSRLFSCALVEASRKASGRLSPVNKYGAQL